jgi:carboxyl-terminal processing protease
VQVKANSTDELTIPLRYLTGADAGFQRDYEGIGLYFERELDAGGYAVLSVHPEGGARLAGIQQGDSILGVEGIRAGSVDYQEFISRVRGPADTVVKLSVRRDGREFEVSAVRRHLRW